MEQLLNLRNLLEHQIEDLYSAEEQIIDALPKMIETAKDTMLRKALNEHLVITREHKKRLDRIRAIFGKDHEQEDSEVSTATKSFLERVFGGGTKCKGMEGLLKEGDKVIKEDMDPQVKDAAIIAAAQKVEHY
jgi:ferritin-like metal-binding protein YciE